MLNAGSREEYLAALSESQRWGECFLIEGGGDATATMNLPAFAHHGIDKKAQRLTRGP